MVADRVRKFFRKQFYQRHLVIKERPNRMQLQTKVVLTISVGLIILGAAGLLVFENFAAESPHLGRGGIGGAFFQSVTARTAGFNTVNISQLSESSKFMLILLMFIGGSPASAAGGIKTVTLAVVLMTALAAVRKRREVEMFKRSVRLNIVARAITVTLLFVFVLFGAVMALSITESSNDFTMSDIMFEATSALGTVGLSTGITAALTSAGKLIIVAVMLTGRLGPLTLLALLTFNLKPVPYNYPEESLIVG
jgi:trk system potassium uptake protein TrkH